MNKPFLASLSLVILFPFLVGSYAPRENAITQTEPISGSVICPPSVYAGLPSDCLPLGPSQFLDDIAAQGLPYPLIPLPAYSPDKSLADSPYQYFKVIKSGAPLYASLEAIAAHQPAKVLDPSNHLFVSYLGESVKVGSGYYYYTTSGYYVFAEGGRLAPFQPFQGLQFSSTPRNAFGWILGEINSLTAPGNNSPKTGKTYYRFQVVQTYATQNADNLTWYMVGPGEWIDSRQIARVDPHQAPPTGVATKRWISVNLFEQTLAVFENDQLVFATMVSSGVDRFWTRPGLFQIQNKLYSTTMSNSVPGDFYYLEDVPWTMYFDEARALHGAYWHNFFGYPQSHGCVNLSVGDAHWLYNWALIGDFVYIYDPSGKTPTDPSLFGSGAP